MPNQFCRYLSNGYTFFIQNDAMRVGPCCWYNGSEKFDPVYLEEHKQKWNSVTNWTDNCAKCKTLEDAGQQSMRIAAPDWISDNEKDGALVSVDINLDNECNAACVICNASVSSLWGKEAAKFYNKTITIRPELQAVDQNVEQIVNTVSLEHLRYVKFFGGEPLFTDTHLKFIQHIPHPENVILHYTTNGSIYPNQRTLDAWAQFKTVIFSASLDGIEEQFNYVRWPLSWHKVSENILRLKNNRDAWNMMFRVEFTANFLNAYYYDRVEQWVNNNLATNIQGDPTEINMHHAWGGIWDLDKMPEQIRQAVMQKYPEDHSIHRLVANLPPPTSLAPWENFVKNWDQRRNNSWQVAFPDLVQYL